MSQQEHEYEPVPGLPARLPPGEKLLWQGAPEWRVLARHAYHVRKFGVYAAIVIGLRALHQLAIGDSAGAVAAAMIGPVTLASLAIALLLMLAWFAARATRYTITDRRVVIRQGIALSTTVNLPFTVIESAALKPRAHGTGDIALGLTEGNRVSYAVMWPHVRPWELRRPQPELRAVADAAHVGALLAQALAAAVPGAATAVSTAGSDASRPTGHATPVAA